jgi:hypothetical protein
MQALYMDNQGRLSIHDRVDSPAQLAGLARHFVRTGLDFGQGGLAVYEEIPRFVRSLTIAYEKLQRVTA